MSTGTTDRVPADPTQTLPAIYANVRARFLQDPQQALEPLMAQLCDSVDSTAAANWQRAGLHQRDMTLIAIGGYGRRELFPHSDIDLLLLHRGLDAATEQAIAGFIQRMWDLGPPIGHSVRSLDQCCELAAEDLEILTSLTETRLLCGSESLFEAFSTAVAPTRLGDAVQYYRSKRREQYLRHQKHNDTEYNLEPDIKNSPGGLRDLQTLQWVALRCFDNPQGLAGLAAAGTLLSPDECDEIHRVRETLSRIRFAMHCCTDRPQERLLFAHQIQLAALFMPNVMPSQRAVEQFMRHYFRTALLASELDHLMLQRYDEALLDSENTDAWMEPVTVNERFYRIGDRLEVAEDDLFVREPCAMLEMFVLLGNSSVLKNIGAHSIRLLRTHRDLIDANLYKTVAARDLFISLLKVKHRLATQLKRMKRYGILQRLLPGFNAIIGMTQFDLYHIYSVDAHTILCIHQLRRFRLATTAREMPDVVAAFKRLPNIELIYIAAIFHDIAKGRGGNHSELGAEDVRRFAEHLELPAWTASLLAWLVRNHLLMSSTAQRQDLSENSTITTFASEVDSLMHLDYLYVLTVADIRATNPRLWNDWRASLLLELYRKTGEYIRNGRVAVSQEIFLQRQSERAFALLKDRYSLQQVRPLWNLLGANYLLRNNHEGIAFSTASILEHPQSDKPLVACMPGNIKGGTLSIMLYTANRDHLFATMIIELEKCNLNILDASITTSIDERYCLDTYKVSSNTGLPLDAERQSELCAHLTQAAESLAPPIRGSVHIPDRLRHFQTAAHINIAPFNGRWLLEIRCTDRPSILGAIATLFVEMGIRVEDAKIATVGMQAEDTFLIDSIRPQALERAQQREILCQRLRTALTW